MSRSIALCILSATFGLGGCALSHGRGDDPEPPMPLPPSPCTPADCYALAAGGCLDLEDFYTPETCTTYCVDGYAQLEGGRTFCETTSPMCSLHSANFGFPDPVSGGSATVARVELETGRLVLALPDDGELVFAATGASVASFFSGDVVGLTIENVGTTTRQTVSGVTTSITAVHSWSALHPDGIEVAGLTFRTGGVSCRAPATPAECGMDASYRLDVSDSMGGDVALEPGESIGFATSFPAGSSVIVTHGSAVEFGAGACEVFVPWDIDFLVTRYHAVVDG